MNTFYVMNWIMFFIWTVKKNIKKIFPLIALIALVLSSLACGGGGDVISTGDEVISTSQQINQAIEADILSDMNDAVKDTLSDIQAINCDIDNTAVGCAGYVAPQPIP